LVVNYQEVVHAQALSSVRTPVGPPLRPWALKAHLEKRYRIRITAMAPITASGMTYSSTLLVQRDDGPDWVARVFSGPADEVSRVDGDAEILRFLASHNFPAERLANDEAVSVLDSSGVIVTEFVEGGRPTDNPATNTPATWRELAGLLGRLRVLPGARPAHRRRTGKARGRDQHGAAVHGVRRLPAVGGDRVHAFGR
jgi:hypothetical protein